MLLFFATTSRAPFSRISLLRPAINHFVSKFSTSPVPNKGTSMTAPDLSLPDAPTATSENRLSKIIAMTGLCSRREAEGWIKEGRVTIDGFVCKSPSFVLSRYDKRISGQIDSESKKFTSYLSNHSILIDGVPLRWGYKVSDRPPKLWAISKTRGELVADSDPVKSRTLLIERFKSLLPTYTAANEESFKPVYRLEYETEGLCLLTNSGDLARAMLEDEKMNAIHYRARVHGLITDSKLSGLRKGLISNGVKYRPMKVTVERTSGTITWLSLVSSDPRGRAVRDCLSKLFLGVTRLICVGFGPFKLETLLPEQTPVAEIKLTPELSALYQRAQVRKIVNTRSSVTSKHKLSRTPSSSSSSTTSVSSTKSTKSPTTALKTKPAATSRSKTPDSSSRSRASSKSSTGASKYSTRRRASSSTSSSSSAKPASRTSRSSFKSSR